MVTSNYNQYSNSRPLIGALPAWVTGEDQERVAAYQLYEEIYWNVPDTFKITQRGTDDNPIYIPSGRILVETVNRYYATGFDFTVSAEDTTTAEAVDLALRTLFRREKWFSKFNSFKRFSLVRGDALWHIIADPNKPAGRRISIHELPPDRYFPIYDPDDIEKITGCHLVQIVRDEKSNDVARRQTYRKDPDTGRITSEMGIYEITAWDDRNLAQEARPPVVKLIEQIQPVAELPPEITALPVYHVRNRWQSGYVFGNSDIRSFERLISGINQGISDEDLALALDGIGVFWTTADRPEGGWVLGPGSVVEGEAEEEFERVSGVSSVAASQEHLAYLDKKLQQGGGVPDVAVGNVDVAVAESGIALALQMSPLLAQVREKEAELLAVHDNMLFDLTRMWMPAYEGFTLGLSATVAPIVGDPMPKNRAEIVKEVIDLAAAQIISPQYARLRLQQELGMDLPADMETDIVDSIASRSQAAFADPYVERVRKELARDEVEGGGAA